VTLVGLTGSEVAVKVGMRLGHDVVDRKLAVNEEQASKVHMVFERFVGVGSATVLACEHRSDGFRSTQGTLIDKGYFYRLLNNRVYRAEAVHKGKAYAGKHEASIDARLWEQVHDIMGESPRIWANNSRTQTSALLRGLLFTATVDLSGTGGAEATGVWTGSHGRYRHASHRERRVALGGTGRSGV